MAANLKGSKTLSGNSSTPPRWNEYWRHSERVLLVGTLTRVNFSSPSLSLSLALFACSFFFHFDDYRQRCSEEKDVTTILTLTRTTSYTCTPTWEDRQKNRDNSFIGSSAIRSYCVPCFWESNFNIVALTFYKLHVLIGTHRHSRERTLQENTRNQFYSVRSLEVDYGVLSRIVLHPVCSCDCVRV